MQELLISNGVKLAYRSINLLASERIQPHQDSSNHGKNDTTLVFLSGLKSEMTGTKAAYLHDWASETGRGFVRFDYRGHGETGGTFSDFGIQDWLDDTKAVLDMLDSKRVVLIGSSLGGWLSLLLARDHGPQIAGVVTIAAAPDFTEDGFWANFNAEERAVIEKGGIVDVPSDYGTPYPISAALIKQGRKNLFLRTKARLTMPIRMLQGDQDTSVSHARALQVFDHIGGPSVHLEIVKGADHSFSQPSDLELIKRTIIEVENLIL